MLPYITIMFQSEEEAPKATKPKKKVVGKRKKMDKDEIKDNTDGKFGFMICRHLPSISFPSFPYTVLLLHM